MSESTPSAQPSAPPSPRPRTWPRRLLGLAADALVAGLTILCAATAFTYVEASSEVEWYHLLGAGIAEGEAFPLLGPAANVSGLRLGPLYYYLLGALHLVTDDLLVFHWVAVACAALAAVLVRRTAARLFGPPFGLVAGLLYALDWPHLAGAFIEQRHAMWVPLPMALCWWTTTRWALGGGARWFVAAAACFGVLTQMHLVTGVFVLPVLLVALAASSARPWRGWLHSLGTLALAAAVGLLTYAPWLAGTLGSHQHIDRDRIGGFLDRRVAVAERLGWLETATSVPSEVVAAGVVSLLVAFVLGTWGLPPGRRPAVLLVLGAALAVALPFLTFQYWPDRYDVLFGPTLALTATSALAVPVAMVRRSAAGLRAHVATLVLAVLWCLGLALTASPRRWVPEPRTGTVIGAAEQITLAAHARAHGLDRGALTGRLHVVHDARWWLATAYLSRDLPAEPSAGSALLDVVVLRGCADDRLGGPHADGFSAWQAPLSAQPRRSVAAAYEPSFTARLRLERGGTPLLDQPARLPIDPYPLHMWAFGATSLDRAAHPFDPRRGSPEPFSDALGWVLGENRALWELMRGEERTWDRVVVTLALGAPSGPRDLVWVWGESLRDAEPVLDGLSPVESGWATDPGSGHRFARTPHPGPGTATIAFAVEPGATDFHIDVFELPSGSGCDLRAARTPE